MKCRPRRIASAVSVCSTLRLRISKDEMRAEHRQRRQAPQQDQQPSGDPTAPDAATDQNDDDGDAHRHQCDVSSSTQRDHIGIVVVDAREQERQRGQPEQDDAATFDDRHRDSCAFAERTLRDHRRYQTCSADASAEAASAPNLHKNPESLQTALPGICTTGDSQSTLRRSSTTIARRAVARNGRPSRPSKRSDVAMSFAETVPAALPAREVLAPVQTVDCLRSGGAGGLAVLRREPSAYPRSSSRSHSLAPRRSRT